MVLFSLLLDPLLGAQQTCPTLAGLSGNITDQTGANIPGATITVAGVQTVTSDVVGHYALACVSSGQVTLEVSASGFETKSVQARKRADQPLTLDVHLAIATVQADVQVNGDSGIDSGGDTTTLNTKAVQGLADDPDDFLRQLQVLTSEAGGDPTQAIIMVDGFQNPSALPPKNSIALIRINPDLFSAKYRTPSFSGGVIEITTKPGADAFHGAVFFTDSNGIFNATNPFSVTATPAGKQRYGFELSGPITSKKSGFSLALEKRDIDEFNVVNAVTLDGNGGLGPNGNGVPEQQTVSAPQRLWIASARGDWQVTSRNVASLSFSVNTNNEGNQGVGGQTLADAGYSSLVSEYDLRFHNTQTISPNLLHETHVGYSWKLTELDPLSNTPSLRGS